MKPGDMAYLVTHSDYNDYEILGVFASRADAEAFEGELRQRSVKVHKYSSSPYSTTIEALRVESPAQASQRIQEFRYRNWHGEDTIRLYLAPPPEEES